MWGCGVGVGAQLDPGKVDATGSTARPAANWITHTQYGAVRSRGDDKTAPFQLPASSIVTKGMLEQHKTLT